MHKKYGVRLSGTDRARVAEILNGAETSPRYRKRANVLLMADECVGKPMTQEEIAVRCGVCDVTVYHTIRDYCERGLEYTLHFQKREKPPRPAIVTEWLQGILIDGIVGNLSGMFDSVNTQVGEIAGEVGKTPLQWNSGVFSMIQTLSETVIIPIAGLILAFVMCYELIQMVIDRNNLHDMDTWMFFKWVFKTFVAVLLVTNTFNIIMGVFDMAQHVVNQSAGVIISDAGIDLATAIPDMETRLQAMELGPLFGLWFQSIFVGITMKALSVCIFIIIYGRMLEIYLMTSLGPIPLATMVNREWGGMGQNYLKSLLALGFQAFLIMVCVGIYAVLVQNIATETDIIAAVWACMGYTVLLCFTLFKTGSLSKAIFNAHYTDIPNWKDAVARYIKEAGL